ncbi:hypothetical protein MMC25_007593 [Agyrium rufum]|nr:hypothetical protein [Agyrium rufum]
MISDDEAQDLKVWVTKRLEDISDADSDVLADYVLALLRTETAEPELRANTIANLEDFLRENTITFVDEVLTVIRNKSYVPGYVPPVQSTLFQAPSNTSQASFPGALQPPTQPSASLQGNGSTGGGALNPRKRSFNNTQDGRMDWQSNRGDRQIKQMRRGDSQNSGYGRGGRGNYNGNNNRGYQPTVPVNTLLPSSMSNIMDSIPTMPSFDPNNPLAALMALQGMGLPGMPQLPLASSPPVQNPGQFANNSNHARSGKSNNPCRDYETKGYCMRGTACPYKHSNDPILVPTPQEEYDPKTPSLNESPRFPFPTNGSPSYPSGPTPSRGRGRGQDFRGGRGNPNQPRRNNNRADFSSAGPNYDREIKSIVVEQIPEDHFDDQSVRAFFSEFGNIEEVTMKPYKRLAIVKYDAYEAASAAYESPKVIFDNRFVKVYWYKPGDPSLAHSNGKPQGDSPSTTAKPEEPIFDKEKFEKDSLAAQKRLEEKKALMRDAEAKREALEKQKAELSRRQEEEKAKLMEKLKAKGHASNGDTPMTEAKTTVNGERGKKANLQTEALKATLAALEAEAKSLGMDPASLGELPSSTSSYRGRGRGGARGSYRGWEGFTGRGDYRGGYRGRGAPYRGRGGGAYNLDNRTKRVKVEGVVFDGERDEGLRGHLLSIGEFTAIEPFDTSEPSGPQVVTFKDRPTAEQFVHGPADIPGVGKVSYSWVNIPSTAAPAPKAADEDTDMGGTGDLDGQARNDGMDMGNAHVPDREVDWDVAEDDGWN